MFTPALIEGNGYRLQRVLNCAARILYQSKKYDHITPLLVERNWLPTEQRINFKTLLIALKVLHNQASMYQSVSVIIIARDYSIYLLKTCFGIQPIILKVMEGVLMPLPRRRCGTNYPNL